MQKWNTIWIAAAALSLGAGTLVAQDPVSIDSDALQAQIKAGMQAAQDAMKNLNSQDVQNSMKAAQRAIKNVNMDQIQESMRAARETMQSAEVQDAMHQLELHRPEIDHALSMLGSGPLGDGPWAQLAPGIAFQQSDEARQRAQEVRERAQEMRDRARESIERALDTEQRKIELYRDGTSNIDDGRYERAINSLNRLLDLDSKWSRADGAYYWKAYALNKLGKRDEALAAVAGIQKDFPQSRWLGYAKALQVEIQQEKGNPVSPDSIGDQDIKLLALQALMSSDPDRAVPLVDKVLNDPKNNLAIKAKALFALAQSRSDKAHEMVAAYAKGGANPDLQIRAIGYIGAFRTSQGVQTLADIYASNSDVAVRRAALRAMANSRDTAHLFNAAKSEQNAELRREAIRDLGNMQASNELSQLYATETAQDLKEGILSSLMNARATDKLLDIAKNEKNLELRGDAIRYLANTRGEKSADGLAAIYSNETDKGIKEQIMRSLAQQGAAKQLVAILRNEKDGELKAEGVRWLGRMRNSKEASDYLMEILSK
ncbi:MAG TPA: HEAT repeat domain-containing protein [Bryobacteraceae bacterium]|nr:HEAT repeat domain-containing protein [Bryobacteraceae bacterium]